MNGTPEPNQRLPRSIRIIPGPLDPETSPFLTQQASELRTDKFEKLPMAGSLSNVAQYTFGKSD